MILKQLRRDKNKLVNTGLRAAKRIGVNTRVAVLRAYLEGYEPSIAALWELWDIRDTIVDAMTAAHLSGRLRSILTASAHLGTKPKSLAIGPYDDAIDYMQRRLDLDPSEIALIKENYGDIATDVTRQMGEAVELKIKRTTQQIVEQGMHTRQGVQVLREAMTNSGIEAVNPWLLETLVRTQIEIAYGAGRWIENQDPAIQEILWGYIYVTAGDDRVRPEHEGLDGVSLPKDDPQWDSIWPPNGFNCRCDVIEVFKDESPKLIEVPAVKEIEGRVITPGPDVGWAINHGRIFAVAA